MQPGKDEGTDQVIDDSEKRRSDQHSGNPPQLAGDQYGKQNPEAGQPHLAAQDSWTDQIAVNLLQNNHEKHEENTFSGRNRQDQQCRWDRSQIRAEKRNDIRHADHDADQNRKRNAGNLQNRKTDASDQQRIHEIADDKTAEHPVRIVYFLFDPVRCLFRKKRVDSQLCLGSEFLPAGKQIGRHDASEAEILQQGKYALKAGGYTAHQGAQHRQDIGRKIALQLCGDCIDALLNIGDDLMGSPAIVQTADPGAELLHRGRELGKKTGNA